MGASDIPAFTPANQVLDLATPTFNVVVGSLTRPKTVVHPRTNRAGLLSCKELRQPLCHTSISLGDAATTGIWAYSSIVAVVQEAWLLPTFGSLMTVAGWLGS